MGEPSLHVCDCCEKSVEHIHWMEWDNDLSWLCSDCMEGALEEDENDFPSALPEPSA